MDKIPTDNFLYNKDNQNENENIKNHSEKNVKLNSSKSFNDKIINDSMAMSIKSHKSVNKLNWIYWI